MASGAHEWVVLPGLVGTFDLKAEANMCCCSCIDTGSVGVIQKFGEYQGLQDPGCMCINWCVTSVQQVSLAVQQVSCHSDCKTKDNVTVTAPWL